MVNLDEAMEQLSSLSPEDALLALSAFEDNRKERYFAKYWASETEPKYQLFFDKIEEDFKKFTNDIKIFGLLGGNRSSKTERGTFIAVAYLMGKEWFRDEPTWRYVRHLPIPDHGVTIWAVGLDYSVIKGVIWEEKLRRGHRHPGLLPEGPEIVKISDSEFTVQVNVNGRKSTLVCKSAESGAEKFQSASVDLVWFDEEASAAVFDEAYQRTVDCAGKILITLTPLNDTNSSVKDPWVYELYQEFQKGRKDLVFIKLDTLSNPYIPEEEKVLLKQKWAGHPEEMARLYGDFISRAGRVYPTFSKEKHVVERQSIPYDWKRIVSVDPAATGPTAAVWAAVSPAGDVYIYKVYYERDRIVSDHCKELLLRNGPDKIDLWILDPVWSTQRNAETHKNGLQLFRDGGIPMRSAPRAEDYGLNITAEYISATLNPTGKHPKLFIMKGENTDILVKELEAYVWDSYSRGPLKGLSKDKPTKRNDHSVNALQYLLSLKPKGGRLGAFTSERQPNNSYT